MTARRTRTRTTSTSKTSPETVVDVVLRTTSRTIYTAGRPPWYDSHGQLKEAFVIGMDACVDCGSVMVLCVKDIRGFCLGYYYMSNRIFRSTNHFATCLNLTCANSWSSNSWISDSCLLNLT